jgi:hypothetical protein
VASIFISYRRDDSGGHAGRLSDRLTARFGSDRVFLDIQDIHPGDNFATSIEETIAQCDCVIAVIGPRWLDTLRARALEADDFVRHEIGAALKRRVMVIPVLMGGARMPPAADLPPPLAALSHINAIEIRDERFDQDVAELEKFLAGALHVGAKPADAAPRPILRRWSVLAPVLAVAAVIAGYLWLRPPDKAAAIADVTATPTAAVLDGDWVAEMHKPGQPPFRIRLQFQRAGSRLSGTVRYPTGDGAMQDVALAGRTLTFYTTHVPQFESAAATIRFQADVADDELHLLVTYDSGVATGVARRAVAQ